MEIIHPIWEIEDRTIIFLIFVWLKAFILANRTDIIADKIIITLLFNRNMIIKGLIFCHVIKIDSDNQDIPSDKDVIHWWNGLAASFSKIASDKIINHHL